MGMVISITQEEEGGISTLVQVWLTWKDDKWDLIWSCLSSYWNVYEGEYCDGQRHGHGRYYKTDGTVVHDGRWTHNEAVK